MHVYVCMCMCLCVCAEGRPHLVVDRARLDLDEAEEVGAVRGARLLPVEAALTSYLRTVSIRDKANLIESNMLKQEINGPKKSADRPPHARERIYRGLSHVARGAPLIWSASPDAQLRGGFGGSMCEQRGRRG